ncbi:amidase signature domain-containing protein [Geopyxis carbonaria]|nr:amidase signature domain-containing protein [Geopyxis carbonaria]
MPLAAARSSLAALKTHASLNAFTALHPAPALLARVEEAAGRVADGTHTGKAKSPLDGQLIAIKDNIATADGLPTGCASKMLEGYVSPFEATVVARLRQAGAVVMGKTNMDEFGMGSHSTHTPHGAVHNPLSPSLSAGGSSGGSAAAVAAGLCHAALGTDTGGSVRLPASYCGIVGFKPSYGLLSRWGVVAYANSLDTVGILSRTTAVARDVFSLLSAPDANDPTCVSAATRARVAARLAATRPPASVPLRIGLPAAYNLLELAPAARAAWVQTLTALAARGHKIVPVELPHTRHALAAYYTLAPAEASSNLARYDGLRYGARADRDHDEGGTLYAPTRHEGLGEEVRRRILLGAYSLSAGRLQNHFLQAQRVRAMVRKDFDNVFRARNELVGGEGAGKQGVDVVLVPTALGPAPERSAAGSGVGEYVNDVLTVPASLAGVPSISVPVPGAVDEEGNSVAVGVQVVAQWGDEESMWRVAAEVEDMGS